LQVTRAGITCVLSAAFNNGALLILQNYTIYIAYCYIEKEGKHTPGVKQALIPQFLIFEPICLAYYLPL